MCFHNNAVLRMDPIATTVCRSKGGLQVAELCPLNSCTVGSISQVGFQKS